MGRETDELAARGLLQAELDSSPLAQNDNIKGTTALGHSGGLVFFMFPLIPDGFVAAVRIDQALHRNVGPPQIPLVLLA